MSNTEWIILGVVLWFIVGLVLRRLTGHVNIFYASLVLGSMAAQVVAYLFQPPATKAATESATGEEA